MKNVRKYFVLAFVMTLFCLARSIACADTTSSMQAGIFVDQVGYLPDYPKVAIVVSAQPNDSFDVLDAKNNEVVFSGKLSSARNDLNSGDIVRQADFSALTKAGQYKIKVEGIGQSYPFKIAENVYSQSLIDALRSYTLQRANTAMHDHITGLNHEVGHLKDQAAIMFFSDEFHEKGERLDQTGGWYDAGDYGKYTSTAAISVANILLAYELNPERFPKGQMMFPEDISVAEQRTALPDVLIEMKYELDWMMKMQRPDGAVYHKVAGKFWPELTTLPEQDTQNRYIYGLSTFVTGQYAGALATASRAYQKYDAAYAEQLLAKARQAFDFLETHPSPIFRNDQGQNAGSGPYDKLTDSEERFWAAAELLKTTGDKKYEDYIKNNLSSFITKEPGFISWNNTLALGHWAYMTSHSADKMLKQQVQTAFLGYADKVIKQFSQDGYKCSLENDQYTWSSAKNAVANANILIMAYQLAHKAAYLDGALDQIHYILGRNTNSQSYLTGSGVKQVQHPHLRMKESTGIYIPGLLVGGPNNHPGGDTLQSKLLEDNKAIPPAKAYIDQVSSYSTNEHAIDLTAPVVFTLAYFTYNTGK